MKRLLLLSITSIIGCSEKNVTVSEPFLIENGIAIYQNTKQPVSGIVETFYPNGQLEQRYTLDNGKTHGLATSYHPNGQIMMRAYLNKNKFIGESFFYLEDGYLKSRSKHTDDKKIVTFYKKNGMVDAIEPYNLDDQLHGIVQNFDDLNQSEKSQCYVEGEKADMSYCEK